MKDVKLSTGSICGVHSLSVVICARGPVRESRMGGGAGRIVAAGCYGGFMGVIVLLSVAGFI